MVGKGKVWLHNVKRLRIGPMSKETPHMLTVLTQSGYLTALSFRILARLGGGST